MINGIKLNFLRNGEFIQLMTDLLAIVAEKDPAVLKVEEPFSSLKSLLDNMKTMFKVQKGNIISDELIEIDARRDNAITGISTIVNGFTYNTDANLKKQALVLQNHLAAYGAGIARDNYQSQTTTLRNILADWEEKPELTAAITALNLSPWKTELATANTLFAERYLARAQETGSASSGSIGKKRGEANKAWYALRDTIAAYATIQKRAEPYGSTIAFINGLLEHYNNLIAKRGQVPEEQAAGAEKQVA